MLTVKERRCSTAINARDPRQGRQQVVLKTTSRAALSTGSEATAWSRNGGVLTGGCGPPGDHALVQVISRPYPEWVPVFTGLTVRRFDYLVREVAAGGGERTGIGRRWGLSLANRVLLVAV